MGGQRGGGDAGGGVLGIACVDRELPRDDVLPVAVRVRSENIRAGGGQPTAQGPQRRA